MSVEEFGSSYRRYLQKSHDHHHHRHHESEGRPEPIAEESSESLRDELATSANMDLIPVKRTEAITKSLLITCYLLSWACVLFVPAWKVIDTSYLFRERDDPSMFDKVTDYFADSTWPFAHFIDSGKDVYRVYFFIMPFFLGFLFLAVAGMIRMRSRVSSSRPGLRPRWLHQLSKKLHYRPFLALSVMDLILIAATLTYTAILLWSRTKRSLTKGARKLTFLYEDSKEPLDPLSWEACEVMAKSLGVVTITFLGWFVLMPIGRRSVLLDLFGIPWEAAIRYHRWYVWENPGAGHSAEVHSQFLVSPSLQAWVVYFGVTDSSHRDIHSCLGPRQWQISRRRFASPHAGSRELQRWIM